MLKRYWHLFFPKSFNEIYRRKREILAQFKSYPLPKTALTDQQKKEILKASVSELKQKLINDKFSSREILITYAERALTFGLDNNYVVDFDLDNALKQADECDKILKSTPKQEREKLGLLFGIPVSVKENIFQKGFDATAGLATKCFSPYKEDSITVSLLRKEGAIPYARSNVPQLLSVIETTNYIWGRANNPWNPERTPGGSSGGEAGLVSSGGSPLGIATDGFSSSRNPPAWCGVYGFKPTTGRLCWARSTIHLNYLSEGKWTFLYPNLGTIGKSATDLELTMKCLIQPENRKSDPQYPFVPWKDDIASSKKKMKIGYFETEEIYDACRTARRAVREVIEKLRNQGHEVEEVKIPNFNEMVRVSLAIMVSDSAGRGNIRSLEGETLISELRIRVLLLSIPNIIRKIATPFLNMLGEKRALFLRDWTNGFTRDQFLYVGHYKEKLRYEFFDYFRKKNLDVILSPATALPALFHGTSGELAMSICYLWPPNLLNLPAGIVPVTRVKEGEDVYDNTDSPHCDFLFQDGKKTMKKSVGMPIGIQVMSLPWEDEKCIALMKMIEKDFPAMIKFD